ncbi:MAG: class I SAM-dependent methyltransferase [Phormidesmis sp.]
MAKESLGGPSDWFEPLYAQANGDTAQVPWALPGAVPYLTDWLARDEMAGGGRSAVVVGCGLGSDAEALAAAGFAVTAFDISPSAIAWAKQRFPQSSVNYVTADLFNLPANWQSAFDLVFEFRTIQALPVDVREQVIDQISSLVKAGGMILVATYVRESEAVGDGPPWPLSAKELARFEEIGLEVVEKKTFRQRESRFSDRVQIQYQQKSEVRKQSDSYS